MAAATLSSGEVSNAAVQYLTRIYEMFQNKTDIWNWVAKDPADKVNALGIKVPFERSPNPSLSTGTGNNDAYATAQASDFHNYTVSYVNLNQGLIETEAGFLNRNANTSEDVVKYQEASSAKQFASFLNSYVSRGNGTMELATVSVNYSGGTPTIATCNGTTDSIGTTQLVTGGYYLFYDVAGTTQRTGTVGAGAVQLASKTGTACTFATNIPSDVVATDMIVPQIGGATDASAGPLGLPILDDSAGTIYGLARATYAGLASYEKGSAGTVTAAMLAETYWSTVQRGGWFTGDGTASLEDQLYMVCNTGNMQMYYALSLNSGSVVGSPMFFNSTGDSKPKLDIGLRSLNATWFGAPIKVGNQIMGSELYYLGKNSIRRAVLKEVGPAPVGFPANDYLQSVDGSGNWLAARIKYMNWYGNTYVPQPYTIGKISGITLTSPSQKTVMVAN